MVEVPEEQAAIWEMIRLRVKERQPLRVVVEEMAKPAIRSATSRW